MTVSGKGFQKKHSAEKNKMKMLIKNSNVLLLYTASSTQRPQGDSGLIPVDI